MSTENNKEIVHRFVTEVLTGRNVDLAGELPGKRISSRGLTYYRLANDQIVEDEPVSSPDLLQTLGIQVPA